MPLLSPGSLLLADSEFDVEDNYRLAGWHGIDLQVRQKKGDVRRSFRKKARKRFSHEKYGGGASLGSGSSATWR
jgi:hypothetical protein